jgi:hypothetical protein
VTPAAFEQLEQDLPMTPAVVRLETQQGDTPLPAKLFDPIESLLGYAVVQQSAIPCACLGQFVWTASEASPVVLRVSKAPQVLVLDAYGLRSCSKCPLAEPPLTRDRRQPDVDQGPHAKADEAA